MGLFEHFPYTNFHGLNLDWILEKLKTLEDWKTFVTESWIAPATVTKEWKTTDADGGGLVTPSSNIEITNAVIRKTGRYVEVSIGFMPAAGTTPPLADVYVYLPHWIYGYPYEYAVYAHESGVPVYKSHRTWQHTDDGQLYIHIRNMSNNGYYIESAFMMAESFQEPRIDVPNTP